MSPPQWPRSGVRAAVTTLLWGLGLLALHSALDAWEVGKIGDPTDIGGGLILLIGYGLILVGVVRLVVVLFERH